MEDTSLSHGANYTVKVQTQYMCSHCGRMFTNLPEMQTHGATHSRGVNDCCSCHVCGKTYNTPSKLRRHVRTHTGEKPYPCQICGRCFGRSDHLKQHMKVHFMTSKRQKNLCRLCGMMFLKTDTLLTHLTEHGVQSVHNCGICGEVFDNTEKLEQHEKGHLRDSQGEVTPNRNRSFGPSSSRLPLDATSLSDINGLMEQHSGDPENIFAELMLGVARLSSSSTSNVNSSSNSGQMTPSCIERNSNMVSSVFNFDTTGLHSSPPMFPRNMAYEKAASADERELLEEQMQISSTYRVGDAQAESSDSHDKSPSDRTYPSSSNFCLAQTKRALFPESINGLENFRPQQHGLVHTSHSELGSCKNNNAEPRITGSFEVHVLSDNEEKIEARRPRKGRPVARSTCRADNLIGMQGEENSSVGESEISSQQIPDEEEDVEEGEEAISEGQFDSSMDQGEKSCKGIKHRYPLTVTLGREDSESEGDRQLSSTPGSLADISTLSGHLPQSSIPEIFNRSLETQGLKGPHLASNHLTPAPLGTNHLKLEVQQYRSRHPGTVFSTGTHRQTTVTECQGAPLPAGQGYRCHHCRIWFEDYSMCLLHNSLHANSGQTPFVCVKCGKKLGNRLEFTAHLIWHLTPNMDIS